MINKDLRYYYNCNIINKLSEYVSKHPELRFHQILWALNLVDIDCNGKIIDKFFEESETTWDKLKNKIKNGKND